jgi:hypothetical protein
VILAGCVVAAAAVLAAAKPASAQLGTTTCTDFLPPGNYGAVVVPEGQSCFAEGPIMISGGLWLSAGATVSFSEEGAPSKIGSIANGVHATDPASLQIHNMAIIGGVTSTGGSGPFGGPFGITWTTLEDNIISGNVTISGYDGFWSGFFRNHVYGTVKWNDNTVVDPDGNEIQTNTIWGNLNCTGNDPAPQSGDSGGLRNVVHGVETGQCAGL